MKNMLIESMGWISFVLFLLMQLPQIWMMVKTKKVEGIAVSTWIIYTIALTMSGLYLYLFNEIKPYPVIINQFCSAALSLAQVVLYYRYKNRSNLKN